MIASKTLANAKMNLACVANDARFHTPVWLMAANNAVTFLADTLGEVIAGQRMHRMEASSTFARGELRWQLLQQLVHELLAETKLARPMLPN